MKTAQQPTIATPYVGMTIAPKPANPWENHVAQYVVISVNESAQTFQVESNKNCCRHFRTPDDNQIPFSRMNDMAELGWLFNLTN